MLYISKSWQHVIILDGEQLRLGGGISQVSSPRMNPCIIVVKRHKFKNDKI